MRRRSPFAASLLIHQYVFPFKMFDPMAFYFQLVFPFRPLCKWELFMKITGTEIDVKGHIFTIQHRNRTKQIYQYLMPAVSQRKIALSSFTTNKNGEQQTMLYMQNTMS